MKEYFHLLFRMINRNLIEFGVYPVLVYVLLSIAFVGGSYYLFETNSYAEYLYILFAFMLLIKLSNVKRNDFLKICFPDRDYFKIRLIENALVIFPFIAFLIYKLLFLSIVILIIVGILLSVVNFNSSFNFTIPTPFYKRPFEFTVGFRNTFYLFPFAYFLTIIAILVGNYNLGLFSLLLVFFISFSFYFKPENEYYVWNYHLTSLRFLFEKVKTGLLYSTILCSPILLSLGILFPENIYKLSLTLSLGYFYLITFILTKYSTYPFSISLPSLIVVGISLIKPEFLIIIIPFLYFKSVRKLNVFLK